jgi:hypothetical protein
MRRGSTLSLVLLIGSLAGCGATGSRADANSAEVQAQALRAEQAREHARVVELEARLGEAERRLASQARAGKPTADAWATDVTSSGERQKPEPLRSQGDFLTEARVAVAPGAPPSACGAVGQTPPAASALTERERLQQLLDSLRDYVADPRSGLSLERREALRVLLRRERPLDLINPWGER